MIVQTFPHQCPSVPISATMGSIYCQEMVESMLQTMFFQCPKSMTWGSNGGHQNGFLQKDS